MKKFTHTPNRLVTTTTGEQIWDSRSVAVCAPIVLTGNTSPSTSIPLFVTVLRGEGCPNEQHKRSFICGYLDRDETIEDCVKRELYEEIGLDLDSVPYDIIPYGYDDSLVGPQNVTFRFIVLVDFISFSDLMRQGIVNKDSHTRGGEKFEVESIDYVPAQSYSIDGHKWAFNHKQLAKDILNDLNL